MPCQKGGSQGHHIRKGGLKVPFPSFTEAGTLDLFLAALDEDGSAPSN